MKTIKIYSNFTQILQKCQNRTHQTVAFARTLLRAIWLQNWKKKIRCQCMLHHEAKATWTFFNKPMLPCFVVFFSSYFISFIRSPKSMDRTQSGSDVQFCVTFTHFLIDRNFTFMCVNENWQLVNLIRIVGINYWKIHLFTMKFKPSMTLSKWQKIDFPSFSLLFWNDQKWMGEKYRNCLQFLNDFTHFSPRYSCSFWWNFFVYLKLKIIEWKLHYNRTAKWSIYLPRYFLRQNLSKSSEK